MKTLACALAMNLRTDDKLPLRRVVQLRRMSMKFDGSVIKLIKRDRCLWTSLILSAPSKSASAQLLCSFYSERQTSIGHGTP